MGAGGVWGLMSKRWERPSKSREAPAAVAQHGSTYAYLQQITFCHSKAFSHTTYNLLI